MKVALAGLGNMGVPIAERVLGAGYVLTVYNRSPGKAAGLVEHGATAFPTPGNLLGESDVCITMVAGDSALEAVALPPSGILAGARTRPLLQEEYSPTFATAVMKKGAGLVRDFPEMGVSLPLTSKLDGLLAGAAGLPA